MSQNNSEAQTISGGYDPTAKANKAIVEHFDHHHNSSTTFDTDQPLALPQVDPETASLRHIDYDDHPHAWARIRYQLREPLAEFLGTFILIMFGTGVDCQAVLSTSTAVASSPKGSYSTILMGWGVGTAMGVWVSAGISGGHLNPAVTLCQVVYRRFPLWKLPIYAAAQISGAFCAACVIYGNYSRALHLYEGGTLTVPGTAALFSTYPISYLSNAGCFFSEFMATAILLIMIFAITDKRNSPPPAGLLPLVIFLTIVGIGGSFGMQTAFAMNPARDFGPRLMTAIFYGREAPRNKFMNLTPVFPLSQLGPLCGGLTGAGLYDLLLFTGSESRINREAASSVFSTRKSGRRRASSDPESMAQVHEICKSAERRDRCEI
ncbi:hypothetical protein FRB97_006958 [Tulasnella sp. 331]|nr:hypothetical protein FRB97_006958 [Tulasnella sp. 331]